MDSSASRQMADKRNLNTRCVRIISRLVNERPSLYSSDSGSISSISKTNQSTPANTSKQPVPPKPVAHSKPTSILKHAVVAESTRNVCKLY